MTFPLISLLWLAANAPAAAPATPDLGSISPWATGVTEEETIRRWLVTDTTALAGQGKTAEALAVIDKAERFLDRYTKQSDVPAWDADVARLYQLAQTKRASLSKDKPAAEAKLTTAQMKTLADLRKKLKMAGTLIDGNKTAEARTEVEAVFKYLDKWVTDNSVPAWHKSVSPVYCQAAELEEELDAASGQTQKAAADKDAGPQVGDPAPPLAVPGLDGKPISSKDLAGKWVVVDFWATWCGPCRAAMPKLKELQEQFGKDTRFVMVSISLDTKPADAKAYAAKNGLNWTHGIVTQGWRAPVVKKYGVSGIPTILVISPEGKIVSRAHSPPAATMLASRLKATTTRPGN